MLELVPHEAPATAIPRALNPGLRSTDGQRRLQGVRTPREPKRSHRCERASGGSCRGCGLHPLFGGRTHGAVDCLGYRSWIQPLTCSMSFTGSGPIGVTLSTVTPLSLKAASRSRT